MRIFCWNVNGLHNTLKDVSVRYSSVSDYFSQVLKADILCFQEAKIQEEKLQKWMACVPGYESFWAFSKAKKGYSGVVTYVKDDLSPLNARANCLGDLEDPSIRELSSEGRIIETDHGNFVLFNVYVPNQGTREHGCPRVSSKLKFLEALKRKCDDLVSMGRHVLVVGDFNTAHKDIDVHQKWKLSDCYSLEEIQFMDKFLSDYLDLFREFHPHVNDVFSVWEQRTEARIHNEGLRIDYAVCNKGFVSEVLSTDIVKMSPKSWSDHAAVVCMLKEQPSLPAHPRPALSSHNMKQFQEDSSQKRLTALFSPPLSKGLTGPKGEVATPKGSLKEVEKAVSSLSSDHSKEAASEKAACIMNNSQDVCETTAEESSSRIECNERSAKRFKPSNTSTKQKNIISYFQRGPR